MVVWHLSQEWNDYIWSGKQGFLGVMAQCAVAWLQDFQATVAIMPIAQQQGLLIPHGGASGLVIRVLIEDWVSLNQDKATNLQAKVLRDVSGTFMATSACFLPMMSSALHTEMQAIIHGVDLALQLGF